MQTSPQGRPLIVQIFCLAGLILPCVTSPLRAQSDGVAPSVLDRKSSEVLAAPEEHVLVSGDPSLTEAMVLRYTDIIAFLYDVEFTPAQCEKLRAFVIGYWKRNDREQMKGIQDFLKMEATLAEGTPDQRRLVRYQIFPELLQEAKKQEKGDPETAWELSLYDAAHPPLAPGPPPLTREVTDACAEAICFMASQGRGERLPATPEFKDVVAQTLTSRYATLAAQDKKVLAQMPLLWLQLRASWPQLTEADKARLRAAWQTQYANIGAPPSRSSANGTASASSSGGTVARAGEETEEWAPIPTQDELLKTAKVSESSATWAWNRYRQTGEQKFAEKAKHYEAEMRRLRELAALPTAKRPRIQRGVLMSFDYDKVPREYWEVRLRLDTEERQQISAGLSGHSGAHTGLVGILNTMYTGHVSIMRSLGP